MQAGNLLAKGIFEKSSFKSYTIRIKIDCNLFVTVQESGKYIGFQNVPLIPIKFYKKLKAQVHNRRQYLFILLNSEIQVKLNQSPEVQTF